MTSRIVRILLIASAIIPIAAACDEDPSSPQNDDGSITFSRSSVVFEPGDTLNLSAVVRDEDGDEVPGADVTWTSSDPSIVTVDQNGQLVAQAFGDARVRATSGFLIGEVDVSVQLPTASSTLDGGDWFTCRATPDGLGDCWGSGDVGQLGLGLLPDDVCNESPCSTEPEGIAYDLEYTSVAAGSGHACAVTTDARTYCWGLNDGGILGAPPHTTCSFGIFHTRPTGEEASP